MNMNQVASVGRHIISYSAGAATVLTGVATVASQLHFLTPAQVEQIADAGKALEAGVTSLEGAAVTLASVGAAVWAAWASTRASQAKSLTADGKTTIVTTPELAAKVPGDKVVSSTLNIVVPK